MIAVLGPVCPCRATMFRGMLVLSRRPGSPFVAELMVRGGQGPATAQPTRNPDDPQEYGLGPGGPTFRLKPDRALDDLVAEVLLSPGLFAEAPADKEQPWYVIARGLMFGLPPGVELHSIEDGLPELHLQDVRQAFIRIDPVAQPLDAIQVNGASNRESIDFEAGNQGVRCWEHAYIREGEPWSQRFYGVGTTAGSVMVRAQAPTAKWSQMEAAADVVAATIGRLEE